MKTDELIAHLSHDLAPAQRGLVQRRLLAGLVPGMAVSALLLMMVVHPRRDLAIVIHTAPFWIRFAYTAALAVLGLVIVARQARAGADSHTPIRALLGPVVAMIGLAAIALAAPDADTARLVMGYSWLVCPWLILFLALPILLGLMLSLRQLAPTRLALAGASAGLLAGAAAATIYGFHCREMAAPFILIWYTLGIALCAGIGALLGPRLLRW